MSESPHVDDVRPSRSSNRVGLHSKRRGEDAKADGAAVDGLLDPIVPGIEPRLWVVSLPAVTRFPDSRVPTLHDDLTTRVPAVDFRRVFKLRTRGRARGQELYIRVPEQLGV